MGARQNQEAFHQSLAQWHSCLERRGFEEELGEVDYPTERLPISEWLDQPFFETKQVVYVKLQ